jgi:hypothetical protein
MAAWAEFETAAPDMAAFGRGQLDKTGAGFLATLRRNGAPRLHPVVPIIVSGRLWLFVNPSSPKFHDLRRDGRYVLHALIDSEDNEFLVGGRVRAMNHDRALWSTVASAAPYRIPAEREASHFLFELLIDYAATTTWYHPGQPDTRPTHRVWHAPK